MILTELQLHNEINDYMQVYFATGNYFLAHLYKGENNKIILGYFLKWEMRDKEKPFNEKLKSNYPAFEWEIRTVYDY